MGSSLFPARLASGVVQRDIGRRSSTRKVVTWKAAALEAGNWFLQWLLIFPKYEASCIIEQVPEVSIVQDSS